MHIHNVRVTARVMYMYTTENIHIWALYSHVKNYTQCKGHCVGHVHDKDYDIHIYIWALYRHVTNTNLGYTYMSTHTIHNVNYSARLYAHANADL